MHNKKESGRERGREGESDLNIKVTELNLKTRKNSIHVALLLYATIIYSRIPS